MIHTQNLDANLKEATFYENPYHFSFSSLNTLLTAPAAFYKEQILKQREDEFKKYLLEGIIIHYLVLENRGFDDKFLVLSDKLPGENNVLVVERIYNDHYLHLENDQLILADFEQEIDDILTAIGLHQSVKDRDKRLAKIIEPRSEAYFAFLKQKDKKTIIDSALLDKCSRRAAIVKEDPEMRMLLGMDIIPDGRSFGVYNELPLSIPAETLNLPFGFRGILDNMVIDARKKLIRINDFKTTSKNLVDFKDSIEFWNYWLQAAMYHTLVKHYLKDIITPEWTIEFRFIVFDKYDQLYAFLVTPGTMDQWLEAMDNVIKEALYHYETREYALPYDFAHKYVTL